MSIYKFHFEQGDIILIDFGSVLGGHNNLHPLGKYTIEFIGEERMKVYNHYYTGYRANESIYVGWLDHSKLIARKIA